MCHILGDNRMFLLPLVIIGAPLLVYAVLAGDDMFTATLFSIAGGAIYVFSACASIALSKHAILHRTPRGIYPLHSSWGVRKWAADTLMNISLTNTNSLYATLYAIPWLRALGAEIGTRAEVSTVSSIDPDCMRLGKESFVADMAMVGSARHHRGYIFSHETTVGVRSFVGNAALVNPQTKLEDNSLIGALAVPPPQDEMTHGSNWLGSPAMFLPRRQASQKLPLEQTFRPSMRLYAIRLTIEFFRVVLVRVVLVVVLSTVLYESLTPLTYVFSEEHILVLPVLRCVNDIDGTFL
jgi:non-ribosomal peptide synthetase-like protein